MSHESSTVILSDQASSPDKFISLEYTRAKHQILHPKLRFTCPAMNFQAARKMMRLTRLGRPIGGFVSTSKECTKSAINSVLTPKHEIPTILRGLKNQGAWNAFAYCLHALPTRFRHHSRDAGRDLRPSFDGRHTLIAAVSCTRKSFCCRIFLHTFMMETVSLRSSRNNRSAAPTPATQARGSLN